MPTENTLTDQLNLVQREEVKGLFRLFSRQRSVSDGFCLVVFRKEEYRGAILSDDVITEGDLKRRSERLGVRDGDTILRVNLGPRPLSINEKLGTMDGYVRHYALELEIRVNDPRNFAQRYLQWSDPVKLARIAIEGYLQRYAIRKRHDDLREDTLGDYAEQALREGTNRSFGIEVVTAHKVTLFMDPTRSKELEIQQQGILQEKKIREESRIKKLETEFEQERASLTARFERTEDVQRKRHEMNMEAYLNEEKAKQREFTRIDEEKEKDHQIGLNWRQNEFLRLEEAKNRDNEREQKAKDAEYEARQALFAIQERSKQRELTRIIETQELAYKRTQEALRAAGDDSIDLLSDAIRQQIQAQLQQPNNIELKDVFLIPAKLNTNAPKQEAPHVEDVTDHSSPKTDEKGNENRSGPTSQSTSTERQVPNQRSTEVTGTLPGILRQQNDTINITDLGMTLIQTQLSTIQHAIASTHTPTGFIISALDEHGLARKAQLATGDIVIEINGKEPSDIQSISLILKSYKPGSSVSLCILRGEELKNVDV